MTAAPRTLQTIQLSRDLDCGHGASPSVPRGLSFLCTDKLFRLIFEPWYTR